VTEEYPMSVAYLVDPRVSKSPETISVLDAGLELTTPIPPCASDILSPLLLEVTYTEKVALMMS
jgi:hypothetical protein